MKKFPFIKSIAGAILLVGSALAQIPINNLPPATQPLSGSDLMIVQQGTTTKKTPVSAVTTGMIIPLNVPSGGTGDATLAGLLRGNGVSPVSTASLTDITSLWTPPCDSSTFLRGDGLCVAVTGTGTVTSITAGTGITATPNPLIASGTIALTTPVAVGNGGIGVGTLTGVAKGNGSSPFTTAVSSDIIALWSGICNASSFLRGDGACAAGGASTPGGAANSVQYNNAGAFGGISLIADQALMGTATAPQATAIPNCGSSTQALAYSTSTHTYSCQTVTGGSATPAGSNTQVQFNNSGAFGASANLTWVTGTNTLTATNVVVPNTGSISCPTCVVNSTPMLIQAGVIGSVNGAIDMRAHDIAVNTDTDFIIGNGDFILQSGTGLNGDLTFFMTQQSSGTNARVDINIGDLGSSAGTFDCLGTNFSGHSPDYTGGPFSTGPLCDLGTLNVGATALPLVFFTQGAFAGYIDKTNQGLVWGAPTGASKGAGTINATGVFVNGTALANASGANPSASVGLAAVNGAAATFLRSDGAPALSQSIAPTWTGQHIFTPAAGLSGTKFNSAPAVNFASPATFQANNILDMSQGPIIHAGTSVNDLTLEVDDVTGVNTYFSVWGDGSAAIGVPGLLGPGTLNVQNGIFQNGSPIIQSGTFSAQIVVGSTTTPSATWNYRVAGSIASIKTTTILTCTSNANSLTVGGLPLALRPATATGISVDSVAMEDNSATGGAGTYSAEVQTGGTIVFAKNGNITGFTTSGVKGFSVSINMTYSLD